MLLSRFWYGVLALALGGTVFTLFLAAQKYNRAGDEAMRESLAADSSAVEWFLKDDSRKRATELIPIVLSPDIRGNLAKASAEEKDKPVRETRDKARDALKKLADQVNPDLKFDALWAVDNGGRVIAAVGYEHPDMELGGYAVVGDALHGWIRDDAWIWKGVIYRVTARPVEQDVNGEPVGAIIGAKIVNDAFAQAVSKRTGAALAFYAGGVRIASGAPLEFDKANLDLIVADLTHLDADQNYKEKGRTEARVIGQHLGVVYARQPGEAWELGAGYAVGRIAVSVASPIDFLNQADDKDKKSVPTIFLVIGIVVAFALGMIFVQLEHSSPLGVLKREVMRFAKGEFDVFQPSKFRGDYKKVAADLNDGIEKVAVKGGAPRKAADLEQVLGPIPAQPQMSAFAVPGPVAPDEPTLERPSLPKAPPQSQKGAPRLRGVPEAPPSVPHVQPDLDDEAPTSIQPSSIPFVPPAAPSRPQPPPPPKRPAPPPGKPAAPALEAPNVAEASQVTTMPKDEEGAFDELADWRRVFEEFLEVKRQCNEPVGGLTFEKFKGTLQRNKDALVARHACSRVKFTVYVKEGKAALKASPVKGT